jgi:isocitrate dehydrogenase (NAD+)
VGHQDKAKRLRDAIDAVLTVDNVKTGDLGGKTTTKQFTQAVMSRINA